MGVKIYFVFLIKFDHYNIILKLKKKNYKNISKITTMQISSTITCHKVTVIRKVHPKNKNFISMLTKFDTFKLYLRVHK